MTELASESLVPGSGESANEFGVDGKGICSGRHRGEGGGGGGGGGGEEDDDNDEEDDDDGKSTRMEAMKSIHRHPATQELSSENQWSLDHARRHNTFCSFGMLLSSVVCSQ